MTTQLDESNNTTLPPISIMTTQENDASQKPLNEGKSTVNLSYFLDLFVPSTENIAIPRTKIWLLKIYCLMDIGYPSISALKRCGYLGFTLHIYENTKKACAEKGYAFSRELADGIWVDVVDCLFRNWWPEPDIPWVVEEKERVKSVLVGQKDLMPDVQWFWENLKATCADGEELDITSTPTSPTQQPTPDPTPPKAGAPRKRKFPDDSKSVEEPNHSDEEARERKPALEASHNLDAYETGDQTEMEMQQVIVNIGTHRHRNDRPSVRDIDYWIELNELEMAGASDDDVESDNLSSDDETVAAFPFLIEESRFRNDPDEMDGGYFGDDEKGEDNKDNKDLEDGGVRI